MCFVDLKLADRTPEKEHQEEDVVVAEVGVVVVVKVEVEVRGKDDLVGFGSGVEWRSEEGSGGGDLVGAGGGGYDETVALTARSTGKENI